MKLDFNVTEEIKEILDISKELAFRLNGDYLEVFGWSDIVVGTRLDMDNFKIAEIEDKNLIAVPSCLKLLDVGSHLIIEDNVLITDEFEYIGLQIKSINIDKYKLYFGENANNKLLYKCLYDMNSFDKDTENNVMFLSNKIVLSNALCILEIDNENSVNVSIPFQVLKQNVGNCSLFIEDDILYLISKTICKSLGNIRKVQDYKSVQCELILEHVALNGFNLNLLDLRDIYNSTLVLCNNALTPVIESTNIKINSKINPEKAIKVPLKIIKLIYKLFSSSEYIDVYSGNNVVKIKSGKLSLIFGGNIIE